jgi:hypothetical protein
VKRICGVFSALLRTICLAKLGGCPPGFPPSPDTRLFLAPFAKRPGVRFLIWESALQPVHFPFDLILPLVIR